MKPQRPPANATTEKRTPPNKVDVDSFVKARRFIAIAGTVLIATRSLKKEVPDASTYSDVTSSHTANRRAPKYDTTTSV